MWSPEKKKVLGGCYCNQEYFFFFPLIKKESFFFQLKIRNQKFMLRFFFFFLRENDNKLYSFNIMVYNGEKEKRVKTMASSVSFASCNTGKS